MPPNADQLDTSIEIVTPENIAFRYHVAGPFRRLPAYLIDFVIRLALAVMAGMGISFALALIGLWDIGFGLVLVFWFLLAWFYGGLFEAFWNGQTPGKRLMGIRVLAIDGQPINALQAVLRNVLRAVDAQPGLFYLLGLVTAMMNHRFQRLGDLACGTMVVIEERQWFLGVIQINQPEAIRLADEIPAGFQPGRSLARTLAGYVQRRLYFPLPRRMEIARHLGVPLRKRFGLPPHTNPDLLLCGLYYRTFIADRSDQQTARAGSPFKELPSAEPESPLAPSADTAAVAAAVVERDRKQAE